MTRRGDGLYQRGKTWSGLLLVGLFVLLPAAGSAECAWVVWTYAFDDRSDSASSYDIEVASLTKDECSAELKFYAVTLKKNGYAVVGDYVGTTSLKGRRGTVTRTYSCFPDTIDPRVPKGGAR